MRLLTSPHLLLVLNMCFWAGNWIVGRGLRGDITPLGLNFWRWALALAWLLPFTWPELWQQRHVLRRDWKVLVALGVLGVGTFNLLVYLAVARTTATNAALINSSQPVVIAIFAWLLFRERLTARQVVGIGVSLIGVLVIITRADPGLLLQLRFNTGDLIGLAAVPVWSLYSVLLRLRPPELGPMALLTVLMAVGVAALLPFSLWFHAQEAQVALGVDTAAAIFYVALFPSLLGVSFYNYGVQQLGPSAAGLFLHLIPPFTAGLAWLLLGESLRFFHLAGALLIFTGIYVSTVAGRPRPVQPDADQID